MILISIIYWSLLEWHVDTNMILRPLGFAHRPAPPDLGFTAHPINRGTGVKVVTNHPQTEGISDFHLVMARKTDAVRAVISRFTLIIAVWVSQLMGKHQIFVQLESLKFSFVFHTRTTCKPGSHMNSRTGSRANSELSYHRFIYQGHNDKCHCSERHSLLLKGYWLYYISSGDELTGG